MTRHYLLVSDFDQTLSFNDSGHVLSESLGLVDFAEKVAGLSRLNLVQSGAELTYLLRHDPEFRRVRRDDLVDVGRRIRCKRNIDMLVECLAHGIDGYQFDFYVVSAAPHPQTVSNRQSPLDDQGSSRTRAVTIRSTAPRLAPGRVAVVDVPDPSR